VPTIDFCPFFTEKLFGLQKPVFLDMSNYTGEQKLSRSATTSPYKFRKCAGLAFRVFLFLHCKMQNYVLYLHFATPLICDPLQRLSTGPIHPKDTSL
jgi:hypothetical protein